ncbi:MAG: hypothetical protein APR63_13235 [Desulfuromonas sp. SDB]|nr:MAG: hypothetical protein APR63_13235 [Desulfuromonas sp. SDB]
MSKFRPAKCPSCGGELQLPEDKDVVSCMYCGTKIIVKEVLGGADSVKKENLLKLADSAKDFGNYREALDYYNRYLEINIKSKDAWLGKAETTFLISTRENLRTSESIQCFKKVVELYDPVEQEKVRSEVYEKLRSLLNRGKERFFVFDRKQITQSPNILNEKRLFQENSVKYLQAYKELEKFYEEDIDFTREILDFLKLISINNFKFQKEVSITSDFLKQNIKTSFNRYISRQKSYYNKKVTYLNKLDQWKKAGEKGPRPKMPRMTTSNLAMIIVIICIVGAVSLCTIFSVIVNSCENKARREQEQRRAKYQDSIRQVRIEDSLAQVRLYQAFLDSLEIHNPDSFSTLMKAESLRLESLEQKRIEDSLEQIRVQDSIARAVRQDSINQDRRFQTLKYRMRIDEEEALNIIWVKHNNSPVYVNSRRHMCYPYIGLKSAMDKWLLLRVGYNLSDWLFLEKITIKVDGTEYDFPLSPSNVNQDPTGYGVSEWVDISGQESLIRKIATGSEVWVIYWGSQGRDSYQLSSNDLKVFQEIIEIYDLCSLRRFAGDLR